MNWRRNEEKNIEYKIHVIFSVQVKHRVIGLLTQEEFNDILENFKIQTKN